MCEATGQRITLAIIGPPNSGKGSVVEALARAIERLTNKLPPIISASGLLGSPDEQLLAMGVSSRDIRRIRTLMQAGQLVPARLTQRLFSARLADPDCSSGCIIEGWPRKVDERRFLGRRYPITHFVVLSTRDDVIRERAKARWTCPDSGAAFSRATHPDVFESDQPLHPLSGKPLIRRGDDKNPDAIERRIKAFNGTTLVTAQPILRRAARKKSDLRAAEVDTSDLMPIEVAHRIVEKFDWPLPA